MPKIFNHPDFAQPVTISATPLPDDSADAQVAATVGMMRRYALEDSQSPRLASLAQALLNQCASPDEYIGKVFDAAQERMYFQRDEITGGQVDGDAVEVLLKPCAVAELYETGGNQRVPGDCDCFSMFVASLLLAGGVDCAYATSAADQGQPGEFSHVYVVAWPGTQYKTVIDASHGKYAGWEAPNCGRYQEWPVNAGALNTTVSGAALILGLLVTALMFAFGRAGNNQMEVTA